MRPVRRLAVVVATIVALTVLVPSVSASFPIGALHLTKTCDAIDHCTVITSTDGPIPVDTEGFYTGPWPPFRLSSEVVLVTPDGDTATGHCTLNFVTAVGTCTFARGTGSLAGFHANLTVTTSDWVTFNWDGTYHFAP